jgi:hypothetical protein
MKARLLLLAAGSALVLSACGQDSLTRYADNNGLYVNVGPLLYQVEQSRQLNPFAVRDASYLAGLPAKTAKLSPQQAWFGVFMLVLNHSHHSATAASTYYITDTQNTAYYPVPNPGSNPFSYTPVSIPAKGQLPPLDSPAYTSPTGGQVLLFKLPYATFDNRPLELHIVGSDSPTDRAVIVLDI